MIEITDNSIHVFRYKNAIKRKLKNKRVAICKLDNGNYVLEVISYDNIYAKNKTVRNLVFKDKLRVSEMVITKETLECLVMNAIELLNLKDTNI